MARTKTKSGPKPKIGEHEQAQVLAILRVGGSLRDAADVIEVDYKTLYRLRQGDEQFAKGVRKAQKVGKMRLLRKIGKAKNWRAAAWMLERRWGEEFGRRERVEHSGPEGQPIAIDQTDSELRKALADPDTAKLANALARRMALQSGRDGVSAN